MPYAQNDTVRRWRIRETLFSAAVTGSLLLSPPGRAQPLRGPASAQSATQTAQQPIRVQTTLVNVFATVRDRHHGLVSNLSADDFQISEDGQKQKIAFFTKEVNQPITLGLLVDTSGSQQFLLSAEQFAASRFLHQVMRKSDMAMVITFDVDVDLLADFTEDAALLDRAIGRARINAPYSPVNEGPFPIHGSIGTAFYDAIYLACHDQLAAQAGRKALVVLTDAQDEGSKMKLADAIEAAQRADTVVHVILVSDPSLYWRTGEAYRGASVAKKLAEETGGRVIKARNPEQLDKAFAQISEELHSQYVLGYYPTNAARDGTFRKIEVEVRLPRMKVLARRGYYAPKS